MGSAAFFSVLLIAFHALGNIVMSTCLTCLQGTAQCCVTGPAFEHMLQQADASVVETVMTNVAVFSRMQGGDAISIKQQSAGTSFCWAYLQQLRETCIMMFCADKIWVHVMFYMLLTLSTS